MRGIEATPGKFLALFFGQENPSSRKRLDAVGFSEWLVCLGKRFQVASIVLPGKVRERGGWLLCEASLLAAEQLLAAGPGFATTCLHWSQEFLARHSLFRQRERPQLPLHPLVPGKERANSCGPRELAGKAA